MRMPCSTRRRLTQTITPSSVERGTLLLRREYAANSKPMVLRSNLSATTFGLAHLGHTCRQAMPRGRQWFLRTVVFLWLSFGAQAFPNQVSVRARAMAVDLKPVLVLLGLTFVPPAFIQNTICCKFGLIGLMRMVPAQGENNNGWRSSPHHPMHTL